MKTRSKSRDLVYLLIVLCVTAVLTRAFFLNAAQSAQQTQWQSDVQASLETFYRSSAEVQGRFPEKLARVTLASLQARAPGHPEWSYRLCELASRRHPQVAMTSWEIREQGKEALLPSQPSPQRSHGQEAQLTNFELAQSETLTRAAQITLDARIGPGRALALVEVQASQPDFPSAQPYPLRSRLVRRKPRPEAPPAGARAYEVEARQAIADQAAVAPRRRRGPSIRRISLYLVFGAGEHSQQREQLKQDCCQAIGWAPARDVLEIVDLPLAPYPSANKEKS